MGKNIARHFKGPTPQTEAIAGAAQVKNRAGGYVFEVDKWVQLRRFLILGTEGGTYYASEREMTLENAQALQACITEDGVSVVALIVEVSDRALAPKNDAAVFALAVASVKGNDATRRAAFEALPKVCRIGTHLFAFCEAREAVGGGWGRAMQRAVSSWYLSRPIDKLVHQALKYAQREGWSHRDVLRLAHPDVLSKHGGQGDQPEHYAAVLDAICAPDGGVRRGPTVEKEVAAFGSGGKTKERVTPIRSFGDSQRVGFVGGKGWRRVAQFSRLAEGWLKARELQAALDADGVMNSARCERMAALVAEYRLERELVPTAFLTSPVVQEAMLPAMGATALVRNLGNLSKSGLLKPLSSAEQYVTGRLGDVEWLRASRVHPFALLIAARTYASGRSVRGDGTWTVCPAVVDALDSAFYHAFLNVEPTGRRHLLGVDVSGSMSSACTGSVMSCAEAAAAMALITVRTEPRAYAFGFSTQFVDLEISARTTLTSLMRKTTRCNFGGTDCAVAIRHAMKHDIEVDAFVVYTDCETWAGDQHACEALKQYRKESGIEAKLAVVGFTSTRHSIADARDARSMDFVGLDASLPQALAAFVTE